MDGHRQPFPLAVSSQRGLRQPPRFGTTAATTMKRSVATTATRLVPASQSPLPGLASSEVSRRGDVIRKNENQTASIWQRSQVP